MVLNNLVPTIHKWWFTWSGLMVDWWLTDGWLMVELELMGSEITFAISYQVTCNRTPLGRMWSSMFLKFGTQQIGYSSRYLLTTSKTIDKSIQKYGASCWNQRQGQEEVEQRQRHVENHLEGLLLHELTYSTLQSRTRPNTQSFLTRRHLTS